jgi:hypothetical protein
MKISDLHSLRIIAAFLIATAAIPVKAQQSGSLADAARQARAQRQGQPKADNNQAQQVADQLSEEQTSGDAPGGFKMFNSGEYKLAVPAPYTVYGHDEGGTVLTGPSVGSKQAVVLVGSPIVFRWGSNDTAFHDAATQFVGIYQAGAKCAKTTVATHEAYQCGLAGANLMGRRISGNAMFVLISGNIYPIFCAAPTDSRERDTINDPHAGYDDKLYARRALDHEEQDVRTVWQKCDTVFGSIRPKEGKAQQMDQPHGAGGDSSKPGATPEKAETAASANAGQAASTGGAGSLADFAQRLRQDPTQVAATPSPAPAPSIAPVQTTVPAGFKVHAFQYCSGPRDCWNASVLVPVDAKLVSSDCKQYAFEVKVQGSPFLLMTGSASADCDKSGAGPDLVRWHQLVDPENKRAPGTYSTISSQVVKVDGKPATITTLGFRKGLTDWMGKRAEVENNGVQIVVGCMSTRDQFADGDAVCSTLIDSLRLP